MGITKVGELGGVWSYKLAMEVYNNLVLGWISKMTWWDFEENTFVGMESIDGGLVEVVIREVTCDLYTIFIGAMEVFFSRSTNK